MSFESLPLVECGPGQRAAAGTGRWFTRILVAAGTDPVEGRTEEGNESGLLVLSGTVDLEAGAGSWISRGTRATPYEGKPVAIFLPPKTRFRASGGPIDMLVVSARRPELPVIAEEPKQSKPLLPLAGSGKAFDSNTGSWQPIESFPDSPEAILPRRITSGEVGGAKLQTVFGLDYKTIGLTLAEIVLPADGTVSLPNVDADLPPSDYPQEWAVYYRAEDKLVCTDGDRTATLSGEGVIAGSTATSIAAQGGRVYLAAACSGPKPTL